MDITYTNEFDAGRYGRLIGKSLKQTGCGGAAPWTWCAMIGGLLFAFSSWLQGEGSQGSYFISVFLIMFPLVFSWTLRNQVRYYVKVVKLLMGGETVAQERLTDEGHEVTCGAMSQKTPWKNLGTHFRFLDDDTVAIFQPTGMPSLVLDELSARGADRRELENVLRQAGLKELGESKKLKVRKITRGVVSAVFLMHAAASAACAVSDCRRAVRCDETKARLFELIHGKDDPQRPLPGTSLREKVARLLAGTGEPDECLYLFVPEAVDDTVGLYARYGEWSCEAFYPCGCTCGQAPGYFEHIKELHKPTVYLESEKDKWLEKVRPLAKDLYEPDCIYRQEVE